MFKIGEFYCLPVLAKAILTLQMVFILADYYLEILSLCNLELLSKLHYFSVKCFY